MAHHAPTQPTNHRPAACDGDDFIAMVESACNWLEQHHALVNQLNVFPVPDGDTGTNMLMTMRNALKEARGNTSGHVGQVAADIAHGAMMGSRGNSGTILSQLWQGFAHGLRDQATLGPDGLVRGLREAADTAYRGVIKPVEGTILTVAREAAEEAEAARDDTSNIHTILTRVVDRAKDSLARTPDLLPILQKAGVVDSGGAGLVYIYEGMLRHLRGEATPREIAAAVPVQDLAAALAPEDELGYGYDVQYIILGKDLDVPTIRAAIDSMGWSTLVVGDERAIKVHVHVHDPGIPLSYGAAQGDLTDVVVENMQEQFQTYVQQRAATPPVTLPAAPVAPALALDEDDIGIVAVAAGEGLSRVFRQLGVSEIVHGGQTNNPSTQEILEAVERVPTRYVIVLPNNKNIILAAEQAARLATDKQVLVIPTRTVPQGISALMPYDPNGDFDTVAEAMDAAKDAVVTGEITTATRNVELNGVHVTEGQIIGLVDGSLAVASDTVEDALRDVLEQMCSLECELVTLYYGNGMEEAHARALTESLGQSYPEQEFELVYGGQAHYHFILSAE